MFTDGLQNKEQHRIVQRHFDEHAATWHDRLKQYSYYSRRIAVQKILNGITFSNVLDIGCGTGDYAPLFDPVKVEYHGIDISENMISMCQKLYPNYKFSVANGENTNMPSNYFDLVLSIAVLEYLEDPIDHMAEISRILKPTGRVILSLQNGEEIFRERDRKISELIQPIFKIKRKIFNPFTSKKVDIKNQINTSYVKDKRIFHKKYSEKEIDQIGQQLGFKLIRSEYVNLKLIPRILDKYMKFNPYLCQILQAKSFRSLRRKYCSILLVMLQKR